MITVHVAGAVVNGIQRCQRCGEVLRDLRETDDDTFLPAFRLDEERRLRTMERLLGYPYGSRIEVTPVYQAMVLSKTDPTCEPRPLPQPA